MSGQFPYQLRGGGEKWILDDLYKGYPELFSLEIHHGGCFTHEERRRYINGRVNYVDWLYIDQFSVHTLDSIMLKLGYSKDMVMYYHYLVPDTSLDEGVRALGNDVDVNQFADHVFVHNLMIVFIEHGMTNLDTYFHEIMSSSSMPKSSVVLEEIEDDIEDDIPGSASFTRLLLGWTQEPTVNENEKGKSVLLEEEVEGVKEKENENVELEAENDEVELEAENVELEPANDEVEAENEHEKDKAENEHENENDDSDYIVDEENEVDEVLVDMSQFTLNVDPDVEYMGCFEDENIAENEFDHAGLDVIDNNEFDSASDDDNIRDSLLNKLAKKRKAADGPIYKTSFYVGKPFGSKLEVKELVKNHSIETRRQLKIVKNDKTRIRIVCEGKLPVFNEEQIDDDGPSKPVGLNEVNGPVSSGPKSAKEKGQKKTVEKDKKESCGKNKTKPDVVIKNKGGRGVKTNPDLYQCPWSLLVSKEKYSETWYVRTYKNTHKCLQSRVIKACTADFLAKAIVEQVEGNPDIPEKALQDELQKKFELGVSRMKAFRAKRKAIGQLKGDYTTQYNMLRDYIQELKKQNPDTTVKLDVQPPFHEDDATRVFKRIYVCLGALKRGFKAVGRNLLGVDGAFMSGPFPGQVLTAVGIDPNNGIYHVAYAVVESETKDAWIWFLTNLGDDLDLHRKSNFTFISDRQKGIIPAIAHLFPCAEHRFCVRHIHENMKKNWRGTAYKDHLWRCATATSVKHFEREMEEFRKFSPDAHSWLSKIPPHHWTRSHFSGLAQSDILLNNLCEVLNKQLVKGRDKPIIHCLEYIREYLMIRIVNVQKVIDKCDGPLTPTATKLLDLVKTDAAKYRVIFNGGSKYQVTGPHGDQCVVDVNNRICPCRKWEVTGIPCKHAVACNWNMALNNVQVGLVETWVNPLYRLDTWKLMYSFKVNPINGSSFWDKSPIPSTITPPLYHTQSGRPQKKRKKSAEEHEDSMVANGKLSKKHSTWRCTKCGSNGHNAASCNPQQAASQAASQQPASQDAGSQQPATQPSGSQPSGSQTPSTQPSQSVGVVSPGGTRRWVKTKSGLKSVNV